MQNNYSVLFCIYFIFQYFIINIYAWSQLCRPLILSFPNYTQKHYTSHFPLACFHFIYTCIWIHIACHSICIMITSVLSACSCISLSNNKKHGRLNGQVVMKGDIWQEIWFLSFQSTCMQNVHKLYENKAVWSKSSLKMHVSLEMGKGFDVYILIQMFKMPALANISTMYLTVLRWITILVGTIWFVMVD